MRNGNHPRLLYLIAGLLLPATCGSQALDSVCLPRIEVSVTARRLWVIQRDSDTVYAAPVAAGSGRSLRTPEREWMLGPYRLVLANGIGLHGTPYTNTIGQAVTHGCIRLYDEDSAWLYLSVPVGTQVVIRR